MAVDCARLSFYFCSRDTLAWGIYQQIQQQIPPDIWCHLHPKDSSWTNIFPCIEESLELPSVQEVTYSRCNIVHFPITFLWSLKSFVIVLDPNSNSYPEEQNIIFFWILDSPFRDRVDWNQVSNLNLLRHVLTFPMNSTVITNIIYQILGFHLRDWAPNHIFRFSKFEHSQCSFSDREYNICLYPGFQ